MVAIHIRHRNDPVLLAGVPSIAHTSTSCMMIQHRGLAGTQITPLPTEVFHHLTKRIYPFANQYLLQLSCPTYSGRNRDKTRIFTGENNKFR